MVIIEYEAEVLDNYMLTIIVMEMQEMMIMVLMIINRTQEGGSVDVATAGD
jgi:hypothetical protein